MNLISRIEELIAPSLAHHGYDIVRIQIGGLKRRVLQIMIERQDGVNITVDDCSIVSRMTSVLLDQHDPIEGQYVLEVSSPGLDRPLVKQKDYQRFVGSDIVLKTHIVIEGRKKFQGLLESVNDEGIVLYLGQDRDGSDVRVSVSFADIHSAKLYINFDAH